MHKPGSHRTPPRGQAVPAERRKDLPHSSSRADRIPDAVGAKHVTRSFGTGDLREAKRRVPATMEKLFRSGMCCLANAARLRRRVALMGASRRKQASTSTTSNTLVRTSMKGRVLWSRSAWERAADRIESDPDSFWRGEIVPLPDEAVRAEPLAAAGMAFRYWAGVSARIRCRQPAMRPLKDVQQLVRAVFNPPHSDDPDFVLTLRAHY